MVAAVKQRNFDIYDRIACKRTTLSGLAHASLYCRNILLGNRSSLDRVDKLKSPARHLRLNTELNVSVLSASTCLADKFPFVFDRSTDRLLVRDLGLAHVSAHVKFSQQPINNNLQMELPHTGYDGLPCFFICAHAKRWIFRRQPLQRNTQFLLIGLALGFYSNRYHRLGKLNRLENDGVTLIAQGVPRCRTPQADCCGNVAGIDLFDLFPFVRVHLKEAPDSFPFPLRRIVDAGPGCQITRVNTEESKRSDERIGHDLKGKSRERRFIARGS